MLDKILKTGWFIVILFLGLTVFLLLKNISDRASYKVEKATFEQNLQKAEMTIKDLEGTEVTAKVEAKKAKEAADAEAAKRKADNEAWEKKNAEDNANWRHLVSGMTPDAVVLETQTRLKLTETDVYKNALGIQFTLVGAKTNLLRIAEADDFSLVREPKLKADIASLGEENNKLRLAYKEQGKALVACDGIKAENQKIKTDYAGILKKSESQAKWLRVTVPAGAVVVVVLILKILKVF